MKKLLATAVVTAALFAGAQSAMATPTVSLIITQSDATSGECTGAGGSWLGGGACSISSMTGVAALAPVTYGDFVLNDDSGVASPVYPEPKFWLNYQASATTDGASITIETVVSDYSYPTGTFPLQTTGSASVDSGMTSQIDAYFDASNSGVAGNGVNVLDLSLGTGDQTSADLASVITSVNNLVPDGLYSESWVVTISSLSDAGLSASNPGSAGGKGQLQEAVPAPGPLSLLGFGLVALALVTRRRGFQN